MDILSLKRQVIEEIKQELNVTNLAQDQTKNMQQRFKDTKDHEEIKIVGAKDKFIEENDKLQGIMNRMRETQIYTDINSNSVRNST